jgi:addiction module HigA family antidote
MVEYAAKRSLTRCPTHPGELLRDTALPAVDLTKIEIADALGISRTHLDNILKERAGVSPTIAVKLGKLFGNGPDLWIQMQAAYDTWQAVQRVNTSDIKAAKLKASAGSATPGRRHSLRRAH